MRKLAAVFLFAAAVAAHSGELIDPSGNFVGGLPGRIVADGVVISPVTLADALANGYREPTQADYDARDAANAEAAAQAAAQAGAKSAKTDKEKIAVLMEAVFGIK